jgi:CcmD family protein
MNNIKYHIISWISITFVMVLMMMPGMLQAAESIPDSDFFRSTGKINVVFAVIAIIFAGLIFYLIRLDRKITRLEKQLKDE